NDMAESLNVSVALAGQLIAIAAATMCFGAPLLAGWVGGRGRRRAPAPAAPRWCCAARLLAGWVAGFDRRRLLALSLLWYAAGHAVSALMPSYAALWPVRALTMLAAAAFNPQAAGGSGF